MEIGIIGAGAMGCLYACLLQEKHNVTLFDINSEAVESINKKGIIVNTPQGEKSVHKLCAKMSGSQSTPLDLVILFVKDTASEAALSGNKALLGDHTLLLSLQNGLGNYEIMQKFIDPSRILLGTTKHNCVMLAPGEIYHSGSGITHIGSPKGIFDAAKKAEEAFLAAGIETEACTNVSRLLWQKLFVNMTINPVTALLDSTIDVIASQECVRNIVRSLLEEAVSVANADGENFDVDEVYNEVLSTAKALSTGKASMCQDIEHKRKTEIDFINGAVVRIGEKHGITAQTHKTIVNLIHAKESLNN